ncbi:beta-propeller fold lactonase family protein [Mycobacterium sp. 1274756.6]|uniref:lactonase family protein n=1 Tax=Mycobacterium sp. 1274756.6 TaxID=1834076 RepID=UPI0009EE6F1B|nr:beta-propeller fold lactonase family protein [Mycobacterium sp. 1274756.6]
MIDAEANGTDQHTLYIVGALDSRIAAIRVRSDGTMAALTGSPYSIGRRGSFSIVAGSAPPRLYATHLTSGQIDILELSPGGVPQPVPGSPYVTGTPSGGAALSPRGDFLVTTAISRKSGWSAVRSFRIAGDDLSPIGPPVPAGGRLRHCVALPALSPDGRNLYVASYFGHCLLRFRVSRDGEISSLRQQIPTGRCPVSPTVSPDGRSIYVANELSCTVSGYRIASDGELAHVPGSPFPTGRFPHGVTVTSDSRFAYVPNLFSGSISGYAVAANGALEELAASPFPTNSRRSLPGRALCSPDGRTLYVVELGSATRRPRAVVHRYTIARDGALTPVPDSGLQTQILFADGPGSVIA